MMWRLAVRTHQPDDRPRDSEGPALEQPRSCRAVLAAAPCLIAALTAGCGPRGAAIPPPRDQGAPSPHELKGIRGEAGRSVEGRPIESVTFEGTSRSPRVLILAAIHGDEWQTAEIAHRLIEHLGHMDNRALAGMVVVIPNANPDGLSRRRRANADGVDLNRNFPASNWIREHGRSKFSSGESPASEPEVRALMNAIEGTQPDRILSIHVIGGRNYCNNYDGPARDLAEAMASCNGYPVRADIGYPTPGSLGSWAGKDRGIPTLTLELPAGVGLDTLWERNREALMAFILHRGQ
jgi:murein peptide amidase A